MTSGFLDVYDIHGMAARLRDQHGGLRKMCRAVRCQPANMHRFLHGKGPPPYNLLVSLGIEKVSMYRKADEKT